jgi:pullulanase
LQVQFHYKREGKDYLGWRLHGYFKGTVGKDYEFRPDPEQPEYVVTSVKVDPEKHKKLWFKIHKNVWQEVDGSTNRSIKLSDFSGKDVIDVYLRGNERLKYFSPPPIKHAKVNVFYKRHDNDYEGWTAKFFTDRKNNNQRLVSGFGKLGGEGQFQKCTLELDYLEGEKELNFYIRNQEEPDLVDFRTVALRSGEMNIYVIQDEPKVSTNIEEAKALCMPKIQKAVFENPGESSNNFNVIYLETNKALPENVLRNPVSFHLQNEKGNSVFVKQAEYTDRSKRRIKLILADGQVEPFSRRYYCTINENCADKNLCFDRPKMVSINRLYDLRAFNNQFVYPANNLHKKMGIEFVASKIGFSLWSPTAERVRLNVYDQPTGGKPSIQIEMNKNHGVWSATLEKSDADQLKNKYYTYELKQDGKITEIMDPYTKASGIGAKRGAILDVKNIAPLGWKNHNRPTGKLTNPVIYEMSIRDFTSGEGSNLAPKIQGKFLGVTAKLDHLKNLGVNCIQLLPVTKFDSDEWKNNGGNYNWGYDQSGFWFLPEGSYSTDPKVPEVRILEFKEMVKACHENGIRVVMDAVHNHTYRTENSVLNKVVPGYHYRQNWDDSFINGSGCGNETKSERPMVEKLIRDYLKYWVEEMGVDGFRFDLMSITDKHTMKKIREDMDRINPNILLYGEAYPMGWSSLSYDLQASKDNINQETLKGIGAFTDIESRNAIRGYNFEPGLATGASVESHHSHNFYLGQKGSFVDPKSQNNETSKAMNYIDIHDDLLMIDFLKSKMGMSKSERMQRYKLAYSMLFNYIGPLVLKSGAEGVTTKHGEVNSYRTEEVNLINWNRMKKYKDMLKYFSDYIEFRKSHPAYVMDRKSVNHNFEVLDSHYGTVKGKMFKHHANQDPCEKIAIFHNLNNHEVEVHLPDERSGWALLADDCQVGNKRIGEVKWGRIKISPLSTVVLGDNKSVDMMMHLNQRMISNPDLARKSVSLDKNPQDQSRLNRMKFKELTLSM